ncbi:sigma-54 dependent transcriptional regulator [bacterium]|nr:sigma-54 dependent transcriptional regulator [bacterium]
MSVRPWRVLVTDDEESLRYVLRHLLEREGLEVDEAIDGLDAVEKARKHPYDLYLLDMKMPRMDGLAALQHIRRIYPEALAVMITAFGSESHAINALKAGAYDYFSKPFDADELRLILMRALEKQSLLRKLNELQQQVAGGARGRMIGAGPSMQIVFQMIERLAIHDVSVLVTGESGTGKELVARAIHDSSPRAGGPFVTVNCAAIPEPLLESELFGHERGAFTGASCARPGRFEAAAGGTILLDEIGEMPLTLQAKLLRVLQEHSVQRVGSNEVRPVDIRVIAATNRDLAAMVRAHEFREDLFFRINVVPIHLPALRERLEDLPLLVSYFIGEFNARFGKRITGLTDEAMAHLAHYHWPGNIRELENTLQRAMVLSTGPQIDVDSLPDSLQAAQIPANANALLSMLDGNLKDLTEDNFSVPLADKLDQIAGVIERRVIEAALERCSGKRQETADLLKISRKSLHNKMQKYHLFE